MISSETFALARRRGDAASMRVRGRAAPIRQGFIRGDESTPAPLVKMLRGGRSGAVRAKLYVSAIWIAAREPHETEFPARGWAELLGLDDPAGRGARRVNDAIGWLVRERFLRVEQHRGRPSVIFLLDDAGRDEAYRHPGKVKDQRYVKLPATFWSNGWSAVLSGTAFALLLIAIDQTANNPKPEFWLSPKQAAELYGLSADSWSKATAELERQGLLQARRVPVSETFGWARVRKIYKLQLARLEKIPLLF